MSNILHNDSNTYVVPGFPSGLCANKRNEGGARMESSFKNQVGGYEKKERVDFLSCDLRCVMIE